MTGNQVTIRHPRLFWVYWLVAFGISLTYTVALWFSSPGTAEFAETWKREASWGLYGHAILPFGIAGLFTLIQPDLVKKARSGVFVSFVFVGLTGLSAWAVYEDAHGVATPDRYVGDIQVAAFAADRCLRETQACNGNVKVLSRDNISSYVDDCLNSSRFKSVGALKDYQKQRTDFPGKRIKSVDERRAAYACFVLDTANSMSNTSVDQVVSPFSMKRSWVSYIAMLLNFVLIEFLIMFVALILLLFLDYRQSSANVMFILIGVYMVFVAWFPLRLYASWYQWFQDLENLREYDAFWVLALLAVLIGLLLLVWIIRQETKWRPHLIVGGIFSSVVGIVNALGLMEPKSMMFVFSAFSHLSAVFWWLATLLVGIFTAALVTMVFEETMAPRVDRRGQ